MAAVRRKNIFASKGLLSCALIVSIGVMTFSGDKWKGKVRIENGVTVIDNPEDGIWEAGEVRLIQDMVLGEEGDSRENFFQVAAVEVASNGRIYVLDAGNFRVSAFDDHGKFLWQTGKSGSGPGEFREAVDIALDPKENIYVLDRKNARIDKFDPAGKYLGSTTVKILARALDVLVKDVVVLTQIRMGSFGAFGCIYDLRTQTFLDTLELSFATDVRIPKGTSISLEEKYQVLNDGQIYLVVPFPYEIRRYSPDGTLNMKILKRDRRIKAPLIETFFEGKGISITENGRAGPCFRTSQGYILNNCNWVLSDNIKTSIDFFDGQGRYLGAVELANKQKLLAIDHTDHLYILEPEPFERIIRARWIRGIR
jgi:hypothetical protein